MKTIETRDLNNKEKSKSFFPVCQTDILAEELIENFKAKTALF